MSLQSVSVFSGALFSSKSCMVYLPEGYEQSNEYYPVIYMLHGMYGCETDWTQKGNLHETADQLIREGKLSESIIVMPNDGGYAQGTFYIDWYDGTGNFEQYMLYDIIPYIDENYRTLPVKEKRSICGLSMGGYGAFVLALRNPDVFGAAVSLSGALGSSVDMNYDLFMQGNFARMIGPRKGPYAAAHDVYSLAQARVDENRMPNLYFNCGKQDFLYEHNLAFHETLQKIGYAHRYEEFEGEHTWPYWQEHVIDALIFIQAYFHAAKS